MLALFKFSAAQAQQLVAWAILPPGTSVSGPDSGQFINPPIEGMTPFIARQPVQGVSSLALAADGSLVGLVDNGFGSAENSSDFLLRCYRFMPHFDFKTVAFEHLFYLSDPEKKFGRPIVADATWYPNSPQIKVPKLVTDRRILTGHDLDPESLVVAPDGSFWIGDEFGPYLLHFDDHGVLLETPYSLAGIRAPERLEGDEQATIVASGGFESMVLHANGQTLILMLEKPLPGSSGHTLAMYRFDIRSKHFLDHQPFRYYPLDTAATSVGAMSVAGRQSLLMIERDSSSGPQSVHKKLYRVDLGNHDPQGALRKHLLLDLLDIADPDQVYGKDDRFALPFHTIESVLLIGDRQVLIVNDNNYPFGSGRDGLQAATEGTEFALIEFPRPIQEYRN